MCQFMKLTLKAPVIAAIDIPRPGLKRSDRPARYPAGSAYNAESKPFLRHR